MENEKEKDKEREKMDLIARMFVMVLKDEDNFPEFKQLSDRLIKLVEG